jgi:hypothetical protein
MIIISDSLGFAEYYEGDELPPPSTQGYWKCGACQRRVKKEHLRKTHTPKDVGWVLAEIKTEHSIPTLAFICRDCQGRATNQ